MKTFCCSLVSNIFFFLFGYTHLQENRLCPNMQGSILCFFLKLDLTSFPLWETWHFALWKNNGHKTVLDMHWLFWILGSGLVSEIHDQPMTPSHWSKKRPKKKYQGVRNQSSLFHFLHGFLFVSQLYNTSTIWIQACKEGIFCSAINDFFWGNNAIPPSWMLILPENWDERKNDFKGEATTPAQRAMI